MSQKKTKNTTFTPNFTKGGVDRVYKLWATYIVARNTKRCPLVDFFTMVNITSINSYTIIYQTIMKSYLNENI